MQIHKVTPILNVSDVPASIRWFESLGWQRGFTWNDGGGIANGETANEHGPATFGSVCSGVAEIFLCKDGQGSRCDSAQQNVTETVGVWMSWWVASIREVDELFDRVTQLGYATPQRPVDESWGVREFHLRHPDGHTFRVSAGVGED
jgi:predicted lactoylglutathione lyase